MTEALAVACEELDMDVAMLCEVREGREVYEKIEGDTERFPFLENGSVAFEETICSKVLSGCISNAVPDVAAETQLDGAAREGIGAYVGVPLTDDHARVYMFCCLASEARPDLGERDVALLRGLAEAIRLALPPGARTASAPGATDIAAEEAPSRKLVESLPEAIVCADADGVILEVNRATEALFGYPEDKVVGRPVSHLVPRLHLDAAPRHRDRVGRGPATGGIVEYTGRRHDGDEFPVELSLTPWRGPGRVRYTVIVRDMTERKRVEADLRHRANHDGLTGLFNRQRLEEELELWLAQAWRSGAAGALVLLDLDGFKSVNDRLGHRAGDDLLKEVAAILRSRARASDVVARLGGDEFALLLTETDPSAAEPLARELVDRIRSLVGLRPYGTTASVGVRVLRAEDVPDAEAALDLADRALYEAKRRGGDGVEVHGSAGAVPLSRRQGADLHDR